MNTDSWCTKKEAGTLRIFSHYSWTSLQQPLWEQEKVATVERLKQESMYELSTKKYGHCTEVAVVQVELTI